MLLQLDAGVRAIAPEGGIVRVQVYGFRVQVRCFIEMVICGTGSGPGRAYYSVS
jgi:hypothetical protein